MLYFEGVVRVCGDEVFAVIFILTYGIAVLLD